MALMEDGRGGWVVGAKTRRRPAKPKALSTFCKKSKIWAFDLAPSYVDKPCSRAKDAFLLLARRLASAKWPSLSIVPTFIR
jgi:hypothetical protein